MSQAALSSSRHQGWQKLGRLFKSDGQYPWMVSHASVPVALPVGDELIRIFITSRDRENRSHVTWIEVDLKTPERVIRISDHPVLCPGALGRFDSAGAMATCLLHDGEFYRLYYIGWTVGRDVPFQRRPSF